MQELIKIEKRVIGTEDTNSVIARELHKTLEIKKQYSDWINTQINRTGLQENVDYIIVSQKVEAGKGVSTRKEYIITTDASKHIAMMSQGAKAKEVRDYFIAVEKEFTSSITPHQDLTPIIEMIVKQNEMMMSFMQNVTDALTKQSETITQLAKTVEELANPERKRHQERIENFKLLHIQVKNTENDPITTLQRDNLRDSVSKRARELQRFHNMDTSKISQIIFSELNKKFATKSYGHIKQKSYVDACLYINHLELFNS